MFNQTIILGNLTKDWEIKYTQGGSAIASGGIASTHKFKSASGEMKEETLFVDLTLFGRVAEIANQYTQKGSKVLITGRLKLDQWTDQNGGKRSKHGIVVNEFKMVDTRGSQPEQQNGSHYSQPHKAQPATQPASDINEENIPF